jgi:hypothetical protein
MIVPHGLKTKRNKKNVKLGQLIFLKVTYYPFIFAYNNFSKI